MPSKVTDETNFYEVSCKVIKYANMMKLYCFFGIPKWLLSYTKAALLKSVLIQVF
jgi:hypothetical protein